MRRTPPGRLVSVMKASFKASWSAPSTPQLGQGSPFPKLLQVQKDNFAKCFTLNLRWDDQRGSGDQHFPPNWRRGRQHPALLLLIWNRRKRSSSEYSVHSVNFFFKVYFCSVLCYCTMVKQCAQVARINPSTPRYPGIWGKSPGWCPDFCDFTRIFAKRQNKAYANHKKTTNYQKLDLPRFLQKWARTKNWAHW